MKAGWKVVILLVAVAMSIGGLLLRGSLYQYDSSSYDDLSYEYESSDEDGTYEYESGNDDISYEETPQKQVVEFYTASDVMVYLSGRSFYCDTNGITVQIKSNGIYLNGYCSTGAVRVVDFAGTQAVVTATSPFNGAQHSFLVDSAYGCIANNDEVYSEL